MRTDGKWEFAGHTFPVERFTTLKYSGQSKLITREAKKGRGDHQQGHDSRSSV
jgi:hypothetical protein